MIRSDHQPLIDPRYANRRAYLLNEMVIVLAVMVLIMLITAGLFHTLIHELPSGLKDFNEYASLCHLLRQIEKDMQSGKQLPQTVDDHVAGPATLFIQTDKDLICYEQKENKIIRSILTRQEDPNQSEAIWSVPHGVIQWNPRTMNEQLCAVEIQSHLHRKIEDRWEKRFANSHLFFLGANLRGDLP
ncbi:MAG: hypothetical protein JXA82_12265 [Sedimentisphaerales bacterium]|nr:hypothetical protein [Sedimentisphaerales bacterium]